jgi:hypothetical protein
MRLFIYVIRILWPINLFGLTLILIEIRLILYIPQFCGSGMPLYTERHLCGFCSVCYDAQHQKGVGDVTVIKVNTQASAMYRSNFILVLVIYEVSVRNVRRYIFSRYFGGTNKGYTTN